MNHDINTGNYSGIDRDYQLWNLFYRSMYASYRAREKELLPYHLSPEQADVILMAKILNKQATVAELSRHLVRQPHSMSSMIKRMEREGLVKRVKDLRYKNWIRVVITEKGERAYSITNSPISIHRILNTLNENERKQFGLYLEKILTGAKTELGLVGDGLPSSD